MLNNSTDSTAIVWFRRDMRLSDNPALFEASQRYRTVIPVYLHTPEEDGEWPAGSASQWWLHHSLTSLQMQLMQGGSQLILRSGRALEQLNALITETGATAVLWNRRYEPESIRRDAAVKATLKARGVAAESFSASLLFEPWEVFTQTGKPYQVFTPFWKTCLAKKPPAPVAEFVRILPCPPLSSAWPRSESLSSWNLLPKIPWDRAFPEHWQPGELGAQTQLNKFLAEAIKNYSQGRDIPGTHGTSQLSPHLHFGEISPRQIWAAVHKEFANHPPEDAQTFLREIGWREFAYHILYHFPQTPTAPLRADFERFPWASNAAQLRAWQRGQTGYPIVDAGMRELWTTGWMHNRVRMIVGSFLTKHLRISWQEGARWFWDTLVDADLASNTLGWQWIGGCGADAAPYFRVFNPMTQGEKFDPNGDYVRRWVPELAQLSSKVIHQPWTASAAELRQAEVALGTNYPPPIVDHSQARQRALEAFAAIRQ
jgi:deoxyribodipyrimidine photo-lyase